MTTYSNISKKIGWKKQNVSIPTEAKAQELLDKIRENKDVEAFEEAFRIHRHSGTPQNECEGKAMDLIFEAYKIGSALFS